MTKKKSFTLPKQLSGDWTLHTILSFDKTHSVCVLTDPQQKKKCILKYYERNVVSHKKLRTLSHLSDRYLLTPKKRYSISGAEYILYPKEETLQEHLHDTGISFRELLTLGMDLTYAIEALIQAGCYEADISPNNIYHRSNGVFCLGDLPMESRKHQGTPPYLAPELAKEKGRLPRGKNMIKAFDHAMQYSICSLLNSLCRLQQEFYFEDMRKVLQIGMHENPEQRYASLAELRKVLSYLSDKYPEQPYQLLVLHDQNHSLFQVKTIPLKNTVSLMPNAIIWCSLIIGGILLICSLRSYLNPRHNTGSGIAASKISDSVSVHTEIPNSTSTEIPDSASTQLPNSANTQIPDSANTQISNPTSTEIPDSISTQIPDSANTEMSVSVSSKTPVSTNTVSVTQIPFTPITAAPSAVKASESPELDIQKKGLYSLSTVTKKAKNPSELVCLYAGGNHFIDLQTISDFSKLRELYADNNQLQDISELADCDDLEILVLSYNNIQDISALTKLPKLYHLDISSNRHFADIRSLKKMTKLCTLNISNTFVSQKQYRQLRKKLPDCQIIY